VGESGLTGPGTSAKEYTWQAFDTCQALVIVYAKLFKLNRNLIEK
jgi:hypothetical protein